MNDNRDEMRAAAMFEAECATGMGDTMIRALHQSELAEKDAVIKALADALERYGYMCRVQDPADPCFCIGCETRAALRLAGRL